MLTLERFTCGWCSTKEKSYSFDNVVDRREVKEGNNVSSMVSCPLCHNFLKLDSGKLIKELKEAKE